METSFKLDVVHFPPGESKIADVRITATDTAHLTEFLDYIAKGATQWGRYMEWLNQYDFKMQELNFLDWISSETVQM